MINKSKLKDQIKNLPNEFTIEELVENIIFVNKVDEGLRDSEANNKISEKELELKMKTWFE